MGFPTNKPHRRNRRAVGRGQSTSAATVGVVVSGTGSTVTLTFGAPVNVSGAIPMTVASLTPSTQTIVSPTVVTILFSGALAGHAYAIPSPMPNVTSYEGGQVIGATGTF